MSHNITRRSLAVALSAGFATAQENKAAVRLPRKIRLAILGLQGHSGLITEPLSRLPDVTLTAAYDQDAAALTKFAKQPFASGARLYRDYEEMLRKEDLDVVAVCGPHLERAPAILACIAHRRNVIAEKPLAFERADLDKIRAGVTGAKIHIGMLLPMRFEGIYRKMREIVQSGAVGEVAQIEGQKSYKLGQRADFMLHRASYGGTIPFIGVHSVDLMRFTTGRDMTEVFSMQSHIGFPDYGEMENTTASVFRLDNNGVAVMRTDFLRPASAPTHGDDRLRIAGTEGVVEYQAQTGLTLVTGRDKPRTITDLPAAGSVFIDYLESAYLGKTPGLPVTDIYRVNEIVLAARDAAETGRVVKTGFRTDAARP